MNSIFFLVLRRLRAPLIFVIVSHAIAREVALEAFAKLKGK